MCVGLAGVAALPAPALAQEPAGGVTYVVTRAGLEIGREVLAIGTRPGSPAGRGAGTTLAVSARYPGTAPAVELVATLDQDPGGAVARYVLEGRTATGPARALAAADGRRLVVRALAEGVETAVQLPSTGVAILDDEMHGLLAGVARQAGPAVLRLTGHYPRSGRRVAFAVHRDGDRVELSGGLTGTITLAPDGLPLRIELPQAGIVAERLRP
jgi:hypothetical protein